MSAVAETRRGVDNPFESYLKLACSLSLGPFEGSQPSSGESLDANLLIPGRTRVAQEPHLIIRKEFDGRNPVQTQVC
jgi:hypothetical protein